MSRDALSPECSQPSASMLSWVAGRQSRSDNALQFAHHKLDQRRNKPDARSHLILLLHLIHVLLAKTRVHQVAHHDMAAPAACECQPQHMCQCVKANLKQISPCSSSVRCPLVLDCLLSTNFPPPPPSGTRNTRVSHPASENPMEPQRCSGSVLMVVAPQHSDIPYT